MDPLNMKGEGVPLPPSLNFGPRGGGPSPKGYIRQEAGKIQVLYGETCHFTNFRNFSMTHKHTLMGCANIIFDFVMGYLVGTPTEGPFFPFPGNLGRRPPPTLTLLGSRRAVGGSN